MPVAYLSCLSIKGQTMNLFLMQNGMQSFTAPGEKKKKKRLRKRDLETHHFFLGSKENKYTLQGAAVFFQCADSDLLLSPSVQTGKCSGLRGLTAF